MSEATADSKPATSGETSPLGAWLVFASAVSWSTGGIISRLADVDNPWNTVFWRSGSAMLLLLLFMLVRDGGRGTVALFRGMGVAGLAVGMCFAIASTAFIVALQFTTVANILLMQAGVPLIAALISRIVFAEPLRPSTWVAIGAVIFGVAVMVSDSFNGKVSPIGDGLALVISFSFALATVITRRYSHIRMTPAVTTGVTIAWVVSIFMSFASIGGVMVETWQIPILFVFGATLALGLALFTSGARMIPSAFAALLGTAETILGPIWVWVFLNEVPSQRTIIGGSIVLTALIAYLLWQMVEQRRMKRLAPPVH
ncbi:MAG: DMT family transporter [Nitratireductor sp.]|nr:DMT family transporter [Nitratireductor sp.]